LDNFFVFFVVLPEMVLQAEELPDTWIRVYFPSLLAYLENVFEKLVRLEAAVRLKKLLGFARHNVL